MNQTRDLRLLSDVAVRSGVEIGVPDTTTDEALP